MASFENTSMPPVALDPFVYLGRVKRDENGVARSLEVFRDSDVIHVEDGDEFVTFTTTEPTILEGERDAAAG